MRSVSDLSNKKSFWTKPELTPVLIFYDSESLGLTQDLRLRPRRRDCDI